MVLTFNKKGNLYFYVMLIRHISLYSFLILLHFHSQAQNNSLQGGSDTIYTLIGDTLFSNKGFKIFKGQSLEIGKASGERDWYNTVSFKSGASWPLLFLKDAETDLNIEYQVNPSIREKDKI